MTPSQESVPHPAPREFASLHRRVCLYGAPSVEAPLVCSLDFEECGAALLSECATLGCPSFHLVTISRLHWDEELSPWPASKLVSPDDHFTGEANDFLHTLTGEILPRAEVMMGWQPSARVLAGYSMSGLFALYAAFRSDYFSRIVSASGSLWYPGMVDFVAAHQPSFILQRAYFSIGNKESSTRHPYLKTTEANIRQVAAALQSQGIDTTFELNPGNHFKDTVLRLAKGIAWVLRPAP